MACVLRSKRAPRPPTDDKHRLLCLLPVLRRPLLKDTINGPFDYPRIYTGFIIGNSDAGVTYLTDAFLFLCPIIFFVFGRGRDYDQGYNLYVNTRLGSWRYASTLYFFLWLLMALPTLIAAATGHPGMFLQYGAVARKELLDIAVWNVIFNASFIAILAASIYIYIKKRLTASDLLLLGVLVLIAIVMNGKRNIVAISVIMFLITLFMKGVLTGKKLILIGTICVLLLSVYSAIYQATVRGQDAEESRVTSYVDNGRLDRVKMAIYGALHPSELSILEYPGQSFVFKALFLVPRNIWPGKPGPYSVYFTHALVHPSGEAQPFDDIQLGWGMTTSLFDEAVANFSLFGLILAPLLVALICRMGDRQPRVITIVTLFATLQMIRTDLVPMQMYAWLIISYMGARAYRKGYIRQKRLASEISVEAKDMNYEYKSSR